MPLEVGRERSRARKAVMRPLLHSDLILVHLQPEVSRRRRAQCQELQHLSDHCLTTLDRPPWGMYR